MATETIIIDDAEHTVYESFSPGWPDQAGSTRTHRIVWKTGTTEANAALVEQRIDAGITAMQNWIAANPTGATLTPAQTLTLAKMVTGLAKLARNALADTTGT